MLSQNSSSKRDKFWDTGNKITVLLKELHPSQLHDSLSETAIVDSGATATISGHRSDFACIEPFPTVTTSGVDGIAGSGAPTAFKGELRPNSLYLKFGIFTRIYRRSGLCPFVICLRMGGSLRGKGKPLGFVAIRGGSKEFRSISWKSGLPEIPLKFYPEAPKLGDTKASSINFATNSRDFPPPRPPCEEKHMIFKSIVNFDRFNLSLCACVLTTGVAGGGNKGWLPRRDRIALRNLEIHQKIGHLSVPGIDVVCDECQKSKWQKSPHGSARPDKYTNLPPFAQISCDFVGPFPDSVRGKSMAPIAICDKAAFTFVVPLGSKVGAVDEIVKIVEGIRNRDSSVCGEKIVRT